MPKLRVFTLGVVLAAAIGAAWAQDAAAQAASTTQPTLAPRAQAPSAAPTQTPTSENQSGGQIPENVTARRQEIDGKAKATLNTLLAQHESARKLFDQAAGYAVFTVTKAGFFVTGASGTGVAVDKKTGHRTYMRMGSGGIGIGLGAQRYSLVILFQGQEQVDRFVRGGFNAKTTAEAAAGQAGAAASSSFVQGIAIYQLTSKGLMAQADVSGTRFWPINELN